MAVDVLTEITIDRPVDVVAEYAADPSNAPGWYVKIESVEWETPAAVQAGSKVAFVARFLGRRLAYTSLLVTVFVIALLPWIVRPGIAPFRDAVHTIAGWFGLEAKWDELWVWLADADQGSSAAVGSLINYVGNVVPAA